MNVGENKIYDICIIGGGINGVGIARDAAGRGLKVLLLEKNDLASATSSASTKLVHGGLRYLEYNEFRLVHEALRERDVLLRLAPHIIWPLNFVLPHAYNIRPYWLIRCGLYVYDLLSFSLKRAFPLSKGICLNTHSFGTPIKDEYKKAITYSDGWVQDARLVALNAMDAKARGADIATRSECISLTPVNREWQIQVKDKLQNLTYGVRAKLIVNAAGPWARSILEHAKLVTEKTPEVRLVQGSHIIVPKIYEGAQAYMFQQPDKRIIFSIPYENDFTLIGTTDKDFHGDPANVTISEDEIDYLIDAANLYFKKQTDKKDIVWTYSGVRPLLEDESSDAKAVTRDYHIETEEFNDSPLVSVFGGKITTYRRLAETAMQQVSMFLNLNDKHWTKNEPLPGGDIENSDFNAFFVTLKKNWPSEPEELLKRYARAYGTKAKDILSVPKGKDYGDQVYEAEIRYLINQEFALTAEDILWRRSKLGLHVSKETSTKIEAAMPSLIKEIKGYDIENFARS